MKAINKLRVVGIKCGEIPFFGTVMSLMTAEGNLLMQRVGQDEAIYIHAKNCPSCIKDLKRFEDRMPAFMLLERLGFKDPITEILVRIGEKDQKHILYAADVKTKSGKKYGTIPSCAIALAMTQKEPYKIYIDKETISLYKEVSAERNIVEVMQGLLVRGEQRHA